MKSLVSVLIVLLLLPSYLQAQNLKIEAMHPQFKFADGEPSTLTSAWFVTIAVPIYERLNLVGQLPFAFGELEGGSVPTSDETIGNPALGLRFDHKRLTIDVGLRVPLVKTGFAGFIGALADIDRQEAFIPDIVPFYGMIRSQIDVGKFSIIPYGGATFMVITDHQEEFFDYVEEIFDINLNDGELYLLYGGEGWWELKPLYLGAAFNGRGWVSSGGAVSKSTTNQISLGAKMVFEQFSPGLLYRFPLDDILLDRLFGISCEFNF